jgi:hypothetical protein
MRLKTLVLLLAAVTIPLVALAGGLETRKCAFKVKARCASGDARVTLADGAVQKIEVNISWCGLPGHPAYSCTIDSVRGDKDSTWSEQSGATIVANVAPFNPNQPDKVKLTVGKHLSIDMAEAQSLGRCGAGAELPRAIVIPAHGGACRLWINAP